MNTIKKLIKQRLFKLTVRFLNKNGYSLLSHKHMKSWADFFLNLSKIASKQNMNEEIDSIVFSKDRAMQLHAFLSSFIEMVKNRGRVFVLYTYSNERQKRSYDDLQKLFATENFVFIEETNFRHQLINILEKSNAGKILFYVDDMIFTHKIDYNLFKSIDTNSYVLALSRGMDMDYSIVLAKKIDLPEFKKTNEDLYQFQWNYSDKYSDWTYPLGVSGYMYGRIEIMSLIKAIDFKAPNSLEYGMQVFIPYFKNRIGLCPEFAACVCVHANLVQTEGINPVLGTFTVEQLLDIWEKGLRINTNEFYNKPMQVTQLQKYSFFLENK
jgi:hypothetical protein